MKLWQEIGGGTLSERERILGNGERMKGDAERVLREKLRKMY